MSNFGLVLRGLLTPKLVGKNPVCFSVRESIPALSLFEHRATAQRPWRVDLEIGETLRIPLSGFILVRESRLPTLRNVLARDPSVGVSQIATYHLNDEAQTQVDKDETVQGVYLLLLYYPFKVESKSCSILFKQMTLHTAP